MQLWRPEFKLDGTNSGSCNHCLPTRIYFFDSETVQQLCAKWYVHGSETWPIRTENEVALSRQR